ncbi:SDR family oxidoreductase [Frigoriglobus tundricola]|uniref:SDR family oxidoreductase n=1 Tax=Frigoriglobus tundricola TaxID=2774151 RepID=UPI00148EAF08
MLTVEKSGKREQAVGRRADGRIVAPDEVANAAVFLASDGSSYGSGIELCVVGGAALLDRFDRMALAIT